MGEVQDFRDFLLTTDWKFVTMKIYKDGHEYGWYIDKYGTMAITLNSSFFDEFLEHEKVNSSPEYEIDFLDNFQLDEKIKELESYYDVKITPIQGFKYTELFAPDWVIAVYIALRNYHNLKYVDFLAYTRSIYYGLVHRTTVYPMRNKCVYGTVSTWGLGIQYILTPRIIFVNRTLSNTLKKLVQEITFDEVHAFLASKFSELSNPDEKNTFNKRIDESFLPDVVGETHVDEHTE